MQVVARSVETTLHKLHTLGFDLSRIESGCGLTPIPPVAKDDLVGIGRTNDAILYGGRVTLWVTGEDDDLAEQRPVCGHIYRGEACDADCRNRGEQRVGERRDHAVLARHGEREKRSPQEDQGGEDQEREPRRRRLDHRVDPGLLCERGIGPFARGECPHDFYFPTCDRLVIDPDSVDVVMLHTNAD